VITTELSSKCSVVSGDKSQIQSAFLNLGINASHAMPGGGNLEFRSHMVYLSTDDCTKYPFKLSEGDYISLDVTDTGCGIPPEVLPHIFEPFFTTKGQGKGNGLGLAATYGMVQQHSGTITVDSIVGKGTHLKILLPLIDDKETESVLPELVNGKGLVLVVDDEEIIRITSQVNLEKLSYSVLSAHNGKKAIEVYTKNKGSISLVLLDMVMPEMNGRDCFFKLKVINPDVRVILMSGFSQDDDIQEMREIGLAGFIHKPFHMLELSKIVDDVLKR
jgi:CheY-like chemotaxis protein